MLEEEAPMPASARFLAGILARLGIAVLALWPRSTAAEEAAPDATLSSAAAHVAVRVCDARGRTLLDHAAEMPPGLATLRTFTWRRERFVVSVHRGDDAERVLVDTDLFRERDGERARVHGGRIATPLPAPGLLGITRVGPLGGRRGLTLVVATGDPAVVRARMSCEEEG